MSSFKLEKSSLKKQFVGGGIFAIVLDILFWWPLVIVGLVMLLGGLGASESKPEDKQ